MVTNLVTTVASTVAAVLAAFLAAVLDAAALDVTIFFLASPLPPLSAIAVIASSIICLDVVWTLLEIATTVVQ